jgi:hypothetical protein
MTNSQQSVWDEVKQYYYEKFGTAPELVDIAAVFDILRLCASGSSNDSIEAFFGESNLEELFDVYLGFTGWVSDLPFSPLQLYNSLDDKSLQNFRNEYITRYGYDNDKLIINMHNAAGLVSNLERLLDEKWI